MLAEAGSPSRIRYVLYAARIANLLSEDVLLAPASASVIPLPHQLEGASPRRITGSGSLPIG